MKFKMKGFTLIELVIAVAIIGILAAIAYPSYQNSIRRTHHSDAQAALQSFAAAMERKFTENNNYCNNGTVASTTACGGAGDDAGAPDFFATTVPVDGGNATYNLTIVAAEISNTEFVLRATPTGFMAGDTDCGFFEISHTGARSSQFNDCW